MIRGAHELRQCMNIFLLSFQRWVAGLKAKIMKAHAVVLLGHYLVKFRKKTFTSIG